MSSLNLERSICTDLKRIYEIDKDLYKAGIISRDRVDKSFLKYNIQKAKVLFEWRKKSEN